MDKEERLQNENLRHENDDLKLMLGLVKENFDLRSKLLSSTSTNATIKDDIERKTTLQWQDIPEMKTQWQDTLDEGIFSSDLLKAPHRTSSPLTVQSSAKKYVHKSTRPDEEYSSSSHVSQRVKDPERLVGEIAFQLDRRILSYVFKDQARLYGFTVLNIRDKIIQVSTHPLTGKVDEAYRYQLSERHIELMDRLHTLGYSMMLHSTFTEFIINTYGILRQRPDAYSAQEMGYNNPDFLRRVMVDTVPTKLLKDLLLLLSCLCFMARQDGKPLFLW